MNFRHIFSALILTMVFTLGLSAQEHKKRDGGKKDKMEALRIAHITEELDLTQEEWQKFWPIYNKNRDALAELRKARKANRDAEDNRSASQQLDQLLSRETEELQRKKALIAELRTVISDENVLKYMKTEKKFKERLLKRYKGDRKASRKKGEKGI